jgi:hypothetical protein
MKRKRVVGKSKTKNKISFLINKKLPNKKDKFKLNLMGLKDNKRNNFSN